MIEQLSEDDVDAIMSIVYCTSTDSARPILECVQLLDGWALVTDSYRCAMVELPDFPVSPIPKWVHPVSLPASGPCVLEYEVVQATKSRRTPEGEVVVVDRFDVAAMRKPWPIDFDTKLDVWPLVTGTVLTGWATISAGARTEILDWLAEQWKARTLKRDEPIALTRGVNTIELSSAKTSVKIIDPPEDVRTVHGIARPIAFMSGFFADLLRYTPPGDVELQCHGLQNNGVVHSGVGPAVVQADDEIHCLMPVRVVLDVRWDADRHA